MSASTTSPGLSQSSTEVLAATIAGAVERQLTQYVAAMTQQVDAVRSAAESDRHAMRAEFQQQLAAVQAQLGEVGTGGGGVDASELAALREQLDHQSAGAHSRIDELHKATRRFDEQAAAMVQHVNDTTTALTQRMDEGNQALASAVEERLGFVRTTLEALGPEVQRQLSEHAALMAQRLDFTEHKVTDRMLAMEERINESNGTKVATLEATIGRIGAGFDDAMAALSQRLLDLENRLYENVDRINALTEQVSQVDEKAISAIKEQLSAAVGEAMLVRIELDRVVASTEEKIGKNSLRMAEIEALLADEMDVGASVQLERLEELERALVALDPEQFVRKTDPGVGGTVRSEPTSAPTPTAPPTLTSLSTDSPHNSHEPTLSSF